MAIMPSNRTSCVGTFKDRGHAQDAVHDLKAHGFDDSEIVMTTQQVRISQYGAGSALGILMGAGIGGIWVAGVEIGLITNPVAPWMAHDLWAARMIAIAALATAGCLVGGAMGWLIRAEQPKPHQSDFGNGATTVSVIYGKRREEVCTILHRHSASCLTNA